MISSIGNKWHYVMQEKRTSEPTNLDETHPTIIRLVADILAQLT